MQNLRLRSINARAKIIKFNGNILQFIHLSNSVRNSAIASSAIVLSQLVNG